MTDIPDYIQKRIRQIRPSSESIVKGSTPVVSFGDVRKSRVATLGLNPSKREFLKRDGSELVGDERRLETLASLGVSQLVHAPVDAVSRVFHACNNYFRHNPYYWFKPLNMVLVHVNASYYKDSACHLDLVQWATDPVWRRLRASERKQLIEADATFLRRQLTQENIRLLLLNGTGVVMEYKNRLRGVFTESLITARLKLFTGRDSQRPRVLGWNINLQSSHGVSKTDIDKIGAAVKEAARDVITVP